jgi:putative hemolysin
MSEIVRELVILAVLLVLNGIFSMSELAIVAAKRVRLKRQAEQGDAGARAALTIAANPGDFLSTVQVGITLVGVIASVYGGATIAEQLALRLEAIPSLTEHAETAALVIVVAGITYLSVIIGELVPKRIALGNPERVAAFVARPMRLVSRVSAPLVHLLTGSTQLVLRLFGVRGVQEPGLTEEEIHAVIEQGAESGVVPEIEHEIVENVFRLGDRQMSAVMTARADLEWIDVGASPADILTALGDDRRDWLLVCDGDVEQVLGIVYAGDLLAHTLAGRELAVREYLEEPMYVPVTTPVFRLLESFRAQRKEVAIVLDEYGGVEGITSMSDILSGLVGARPADGQLGENPVIVHNRDGTWTADGRVDIEDVQDALGVPALGNQPHRRYRTLAGFIMTQSGRVPVSGGTVSAEGFDFHVEATEGRRIERVRIERHRTFDHLRTTSAENPDAPPATPH